MKCAKRFTDLCIQKSRTRHDIDFDRVSRYANKGYPVFNSKLVIINHTLSNVETVERGISHLIELMEQ